MLLSSLPRLFAGAHPATRSLLGLMCLLLGLAPLNVEAQEQEAEEGESAIDLQALFPKTPPAFTLLGVEPTAVQRPATPSDLALGLSERVQELDTVPRDLAIEVSPYWLFPHPMLRWERDAGQRDVLTSLQRTFAVSVAAAPLSEAPNIVGASLGFQASLLSGRLSTRSRQALLAREGRLTRRSFLSLSVAAQFIEPLEPFRTEALEYVQRLPEEMQARMLGEQAIRRAYLVAEDSIDVLKREGTVTEAELRPVVLEGLTAINDAARTALGTLPDSLRRGPLADLEASYRRAQADINEATLQNRLELDALTDSLIAEPVEVMREGWFWNVAGGWGWAFPEAEWGGARLYRGGVWMTFSYEGGGGAFGGQFVPLLTARYLHEADSTLGGPRDLLDVGARAVLSGKTYAASVEGLLRLSSEEDAGSTYRIAGIVELAVQRDLWLRATFGRDFEKEVEGNLLAQLGLVLSLDRDRYKVGPGED